MFTYLQNKLMNGVIVDTNWRCDTGTLERGPRRLDMYTIAGSITLA